MVSMWNVSMDFYEYLLWRHDLMSVIFFFGKPTRTVLVYLSYNICLIQIGKGGRLG